MAMGKNFEFAVELKHPTHGSGFAKFYLQEDYDAEGNFSTLSLQRATVNHSQCSGEFYLNVRIETSIGTVIADLTDNFYSGVIPAPGTETDVAGNLPGVTGFPMVSGRIYHEPTGEKTVALRYTIDSLFSNEAGWIVEDKVFAQTLELTRIARVSKVLAVDGCISKDVPLQILAAARRYTHTLRYTFGNASGVIAEDVSDSSCLWKPPIELCRQLPNANSGACTITCETYLDGVLQGESAVTIQLAVPDSVRLTMSPGWVSVAADNSLIDNAVSCYVQGYSRAAVTFEDSMVNTATAVGATIASRKVELLGKVITSAPFNSDLLQQAGTVNIKCSLTDTRGRTVSDVLTINVEPYAGPTLSDISLYRATRDGTAGADGTYIAAKATAHISSLAGQNTATLYARYRESGSDITNYMTIESGVLCVVGNGEISTEKSWCVDIRLSDELGNRTEYSGLVPTENVFFSGREGGKAAGFGKHPDRNNLLDVQWDLHVAGNAAVAGNVTVGGKTLLDLIYPIGSIFTSTANTSPAGLLGGTWERIKDCFLLAAGDAYAAGTTGGEAQTVLRVRNLPELSGDIVFFAHNGTVVADAGGVFTKAATVANQFGDVSPVTQEGLSSVSQLHFSSHARVHDGVSQEPLTNLPPYTAVYIWKRTA